MVWDELAKDAEGDNVRDRDRWVGVYIGILAVLLAICSMGGGNAAKDMTLKNIEAANTWAFFQAKNMRRHVLRVEVDDLTLRLKAEPDLTADGRAAIEAKIAEYKKQDEILTAGDPAKPVEAREGLDQLFEKGKRLEVERDVAMRKDPYFDYGEALLQIAIVLASISIITKGSMLLAASGLLAAAGGFLAFNGFTLAFAIPGLG
ncbi:MAG: hypothetical protein C0519_14360 [Hyphomicrobium sp.]|jgi:hypothetical protein|nr:hypothetical protein [Hyphomicrobium sp.]